MLWDIFCKVIDNHGDIGVCWRLSAQLAQRGEQVRLWVDDPAALRWMAPEGQPGVQVLPWQAQAAAQPGQVVVEAFGCELEPTFLAAMARATFHSGRQPAWINLEYLTAESFAERNHRLPSPLLAGPAAGLIRHFFYPGFTPRTGGLLREDDLSRRQASFDRDLWLASQGIAGGEDARLVSLFCYEPAGLHRLLAQWGRGPRATRLLATAGRASEALRAALQRIDGEAPSWNGGGLLSISWLPLLSQRDYDHLLWACDLNFVRGEDSLVRALWAGKPLVWHIYPQQDAAHHRKLEAFLDWLEAPAVLRDFHRAWNGVSADAPALAVDTWAACVARARERLLAQPDLVTQLMRFALDDLQAGP
jgi:uncharacterized repeat protein (TIGR03837 family)